MKTIDTLIILVIALLCACNAKIESNTKEEVKDSIEVRHQDTLQSISDNVPTDKKIEIIDNKFANMPLGESNFYDKDLRQYFKGPYDIIKQTVKNRYTDAIDTLMYFRAGNSSVKFYKTSDKILLDSVNVLDKSFIVLKKDIEIGMSKQALLAYFNINNASIYADSISVTNDEASGFISFLFLNKKLYKIVSYSYFD